MYLLFDLDGTLTEPKVGITKSVAYALDSFGIKTENLDDLCKFIGPPLVDSFMEFYGFSFEKAKEATEKYREYFSVTGIYENEVYDGIPEMLEKLYNKGHKIILATSKPHVFANKILEHFDLSKYFTFVSGSELDGTRNNKDDIIAYAIEQAGITDLDELIMVGDRKFDIIGANKIGVKSIGVLYGHGDFDELNKEKPMMIAKDVKELEEYLLKL